MDEKKRKPGRPKGSKKEGKKSPKILLNLLKTKAWAWTCAYYLSVDEQTPLTAYALTQEANKKLLRKNPNCQYLHDTIRWSRWLRGLRGVSPATVRCLWEEPQNAYLVGPWIDDQNMIPGGGAFVPLWAALNGTEDLRKKWKVIPLHAWEGWGPEIVIGEDTPSPDLIVDPNFVPSLQDFRSDASLYHFLLRIASSQNVPRLLAFTAAITLARINGSKKILFFDPNPALPFSLSPHSRIDLYKALKEMNISFPEIASVANHFGLEMHDCSTLDYVQYVKLRWGRNDKTSILGHMTEQEWRAIFGTSS